MSKSDTVRGLVADGDYKRALRIVKGFRLGIAQGDISKMTLAYECLVHTGFYEELGTDTARAVSEGIQTLIDLYGQGEGHG
jgi:hypothetical protein